MCPRSDVGEKIYHIDKKSVTHTVRIRISGIQRGPRAITVTPKISRNMQDDFTALTVQPNGMTIIFVNITFPPLSSEYMVDGW